jgi:MFS family permease
MTSSNNNNRLSRSSALKFVVLLGLVSMLADATYEGARSINGQFLAVLGASGALVGFVSGFGELIGYGIRLVSGYLSDRTRQYWLITIGGYIINLLAVPLLALAGSWQLAAVLMVTERVGKGIRTPARDAMLSHATYRTGRGWGFGLHEALDQVGAVTGPLIITLVLFLNGSYQSGYFILLIPALMALSVLAAARFLYPDPRSLEVETPELRSRGFSRAFWLYLAAMALLALGFADFPLIAFHFEKTGAISLDFIPVLYAIAMGVDAIAALVFGRLFDRYGVFVIALAALFSAFFAPLAFGNSLLFAVSGMMLWGIGMGAQESVMRAAIAEMIPADRRASAYGIFNTVYGLFWFAGSAALGLLYDISIPALIIFSVTAQLLAIPVLLIVKRMYPTRPRV